jgi:predicted Zn-dependent protease
MNILNSPKSLVLTILIALTMPLTAHAADTGGSGGSSTPVPIVKSTPSSTPTPEAKQVPAAPGKSLTTELAKIRVTIYAKNYKSARTALIAVNKEFPNDADVNNLLGYTSRKSNLLKDAATYYSKALSIDPKHLGALEYQGELFLLTNKASSAKKNLRKLKALCGVNCEEYLDLKQAIGKK